MAVVHCHCSEVIPFANTGIALQPMHHMGFFIGQGVPVFEIRKTGGDTNMLIGTPALGKAVAEALDGKSAVLMRGHGAAIAATSLHLAVAMSYYLNLNARLQYQAMQLGGK
jgi:ribulose-5-phosphate 4-epimerase/fuculose-1-phosphate aldolase